MKRIIREEIIEFEQSDYENFARNIGKLTGQELFEIVYPRINGYINYAYDSPDEHEFEKFKLYNSIIEAVRRLRDNNEA